LEDILLFSLSNKKSRAPFRDSSGTNGKTIVKNFLSPEKIVYALLGIMLGILWNLVSNWLSAANWFVISVFFVVLLLVAMFAIGFYLRRREVLLETTIQTITLRSPEERQRRAHTGAVAFVSLFEPQKDSPATRLSSDERAKAAKEGDYTALYLEKSNLGSTIEAISSQTSRLQHCWLISTSDSGPDKPGSINYIPALVKCLKEKYSLTCEFHYGPQYMVSLADDAEVITKVRNMVNDIFCEADKFKLQKADVVSDITCGVRSMQTGMMVSCMENNRDLQYVVSERDNSGRPTGQPFPMLIHFDLRKVNLPLSSK
jgi:hypothetical protein